MYTQFFKLTHSPFSIAPDPRFLFMSERHREALAHLLYGVAGGGGFVLLTGEIGAGKTTVCRCFLEQIPENCNVGYIFNPKLTVNELLKSICDEFRVDYHPQSGDPASIKGYVDALNAFLLQAHANRRHNVLIIDEAQSLSAEVLEQLRLLTNLETNERKLLQIILIGQPELRTLLEKPELRQLAQRVIARYHLDSLSRAETARYVQHRLAVAGIAAASPLPASLTKSIHLHTQGVPRRINLLCDRALLGAYAEGKATVNRRILDKAAREVFGSSKTASSDDRRQRWNYAALGIVGGAALAGAAAFALIGQQPSQASKRNVPAPTVAAPLAPPQKPASAPAIVAKPVVAVVAAVAPPPNFDLDQAPGTVPTDAQSTYRKLAKLWGQTLADGDPCQVLQTASLRCFSSNKGFAELRQLDRPAVLNLRDPANQPYTALLTGLTDTQALLTIGDTSYTVNLIALAHHFQGDFVTLWKVPAGFREKVHRGDRGEDIDWIAAQLAKLNGAPPPAANQPFELAMIRQIREFQSAQGLQPDGLIGPKTLMQLNRATDPSEPRLQRTLVAATEPPRK
ncbi:MAG: AAA family ATPase [Burkholderiaceae bacterium]|nr:AAA family ATPase [Burkholderiaceae bacterium]